MMVIKLINNKCFFLLICFSIPFGVLFSGCSFDRISGGTTDTGNAKIAAFIYSKDGVGVQGASVILSPADYLSETGPDFLIVRNKLIQETFTDRNGYFEFDSVPDGEFNIEVNDRRTSAVLINVSVTASDTQQIKLKDTLQPYAVLNGKIDITSDSLSKRYLLISGLDRKIQLTKDGSFTVNDLPEGNFHLVVVSENDATSKLEIDTLRVVSSKTTTISAEQWEYTALITLNTTSNGASISSRLYNFPILIQLTNNNFKFNQTTGNGSDCRFEKTDGTPLPYSIEKWDSVQERASIWVLMDTIYNDAIDTICMYWGNTATRVISTKAVFDTTNAFLTVYHFNSTIKNASSALYDGIDSGTIDQSDGKIGNARYFDGKSFISFGILPAISEGSISCWFRPKTTFDTSVINPQGIWGKTVDNNTNYHISLRGKLVFIDSQEFPASLGTTSGFLWSKFENLNNKALHLYSTTNTFTTGMWYHVSLNWRSDSTNLYLNGISEFSKDRGFTVNGNAVDEIGRVFYDSANVATGQFYYFNGTIDEFRIEKSRRSASWVKLCYINQSQADLFVRLRR